MEIMNFVVGLTEISKSKELRLTGEARGFSAYTVQWPVRLFSRDCIQSVPLNLTLQFANSTIWHSVYKKEWSGKQYLTAFTSNHEGTRSCILCVVLGSLNSEEIKLLSWEVCLLFSPRENTRALWSGNSRSPAVNLACTSEHFYIQPLISLRCFPTDLPAFQLKNTNKGLCLSHWKTTILNSSFAAFVYIHFISFPKLQLPHPRYLCCNHQTPGSCKNLNSPNIEANSN